MPRYPGCAELLPFAAHRSQFEGRPDPAASTVAPPPLPLPELPAGLAVISGAKARWNEWKKRQEAISTDRPDLTRRLQGLLPLLDTEFPEVAPAQEGEKRSAPVIGTWSEWSEEWT